MQSGLRKKGCVCGIILMLIVSIFAMMPIIVDAEESKIICHTSKPIKTGLLHLSVEPEGSKESENLRLNFNQLQHVQKEFQVIEGYYVNSPEQIGRVGAVTQHLAKQSLGIELIELRTPHTRHFRSPDGNMVAIISMMSTSYLAGDGTWNDIDNNVPNLPLTRNTNESVCNYYGFTDEVNNDGEDPYLYMYTPPDHYYVGIGWEDGDGVFNVEDWFRGFAQWDTSSIPDEAEIISVGLKFYLSDYTYTPLGDDDWSYHEIWLDVYQMSNKPSNYYGDTYSSVLHNDARDGTKYYHASGYIYASTPGWKPSSSSYYDLDGAEVHLENQLASNWFAVGLTDYYEETYDEGVCLVGGNEWLKVVYSRPPTVSSSDVISYPTAIYPGIEHTVVAKYHDPDGYDDIHYCWLRLDSDAGSPVEEYLDLRWEDGGTTYVDPTDSEYITILSVSESSSGTTTTLTWYFMLDWDWTEDTGIDIGLKVEDDHGFINGWVYKEADIDYENDIYLHDLTVTCASDWNGGNVEDGDWIGPDDDVTVSGHFYYEGSTIPPLAGEIIADIYADYNYTGVSDALDSNGYFNDVFASASNTDLDYLIDVIASSIPDGGSESNSAENGKSAKIDADLPTTPDPDDGVDGWSNDNTPTFTWNATDNHSGINGYYWKVDNGSETWTNATQVTLPAQSDGNHTFYVRAEDKVGNTGNTGQHTFYIDTTAPVTTCTLEGEMEGDVYTSNVTVILNATDEMSGVQLTNYKLDDGGWEIYIEPFVVSEAGEHTVYYYSVDNVDNEEEEKNCTFIIGHSPNKPTIDGPASGTVGEEYEYTFVATDPDDNDVYYYIEWGDGNIEEWIGPYPSGEEITVSHTWTAADEYEIRAKAKDIYDVESEWSDPFVVTIVENNPPDIPIIDGPTSGEAGTNYYYNFTINDIDGDSMDLWVDWDDGTQGPYIGPYESGIVNLGHTWSEEGDYTIKAKAKDVYGDESEWGMLEVTMPMNQPSLQSQSINIHSFIKRLML